LPKNKRRKELEQIRDAPNGERKITAIFDEDLGSKPPKIMAGSFVQAMIEHILAREFPESKA
jgi:hypothetical protein